jgi:hypothetical protein
MKQKDIQRAVSLIDARTEIFKLKSGALNGALTIATEGRREPLMITGPVVEAIIQLLITANTTELAEIGITDLSQWTMPSRPPSPKGEL